MPKFVTRDPKTIPLPVVKVTELWLEQRGDGSIAVCARSSEDDGDEYDVLEVTPTGKWYFNEGLPASLGFDLDDLGRIYQWVSF